MGTAAVVLAAACQHAVSAVVMTFPYRELNNAYR